MGPSRLGSPLRRLARRPVSFAQLGEGGAEVLGGGAGLTVGDGAAVDGDDGEQSFGRAGDEGFPGVVQLAEVDVALFDGERVAGAGEGEDVLAGDAAEDVARGGDEPIVAREEKDVGAGAFGDDAALVVEHVIGVARWATYG